MCCLLAIGLERLQPQRRNCFQTLIQKAKGASDGKRWPWNHMSSFAVVRNVMMVADACSIATRNEAAIPEDQTSPSLKLQTE
ncbi:hypothetical protein V6N13_097831 [Hibiscus sabdariffa]|uniref:Uncharacterized protein n=1 Tax=Hibiscus sabdariffa TaxID=183260 RepID=A0ABR2QZ26_9ROSI